MISSVIPNPFFKKETTYWKSLIFSQGYKAQCRALNTGNSKPREPFPRHSRYILQSLYEKNRSVRKTHPLSEKKKFKEEKKKALVIEKNIRARFLIFFFFRILALRQSFKKFLNASGIFSSAIFFFFFFETDIIGVCFDLERKNKNEIHSYCNYIIT